MAAAESPSPAFQAHAFQADVSRLLDLMVHSVYSERDIFLRELVSNGADACEKLRYEALADPALTADDSHFLITVTLDKDAKTLIVADNGIGMSEADLTQSLGTIARSGTRAFLDRLNAEAKEDAAAGKDLIGQFGIGFYSAFMVADRIDVETRKAGSNEAFLWSSDGKGTFSIAPLAIDAAPARGTRVILHLKEDAAGYLEPHKAEHILREHSSAITVPIALIEAPGQEPRRLTEGSALWTKPKSAVTEEEYTEFYRDLAGQFDAPALTLHWRAEGRHEYTVLAFVPGSRPFDLFDTARKGRGKLYVRHVLIAADADLLPGWLRFVRLVVDSADLPLNMSRELIQQSPVFAAIKKAVANRVMQELTKLEENDPEAYAKVWENFGAVLKEGLYEDPERRDALFKLARFASTADPEGKRTLAAYVAALRPNQTAIYYLNGDNAKALAASPQLEGFRARGIEVLLLSDPVDAFWVSTAAGYDGKPFKSVSQGAADIKSIPLLEGEDKAAEPPSAALASLFALMKQELEGVASDVRASDRLSESPACLIAPEHGFDRRLERILAEHGQLKDVAKPVLEINPAHPLIAALAEKVGHADKAALADIIWLVFDEARLLDGEKPANAADFATRLTRVLTKAVTEPAAKA
ncbi:molecular chaperone HtpG [uncultured Methylovirgula sp.]|uniref:molecular chaperone HtpG n=1 Tax=uncultured Methylovirgula sp. TaxID=1285960 RepID=UPI002633C3DE|nr:molecular chaperone HtpG [uncultured Methylovirgula sp.]